MSDSVRPHRWQPTRLPHPWDSPGKNTGVGCHFLLQCMEVKSESEVAQSQTVSTSSFCQELFFIHSAGPTEHPNCRSCIFPAGFCVGSRVWTLLRGTAYLSCGNGLSAGMKSSSARGQVDVRHHSPGMTLPSQPVAKPQEISQDWLNQQQPCQIKT